MRRIEKESKVALVALSNALSQKMLGTIEELCKELINMGIYPVCSAYLYQKDSVRGAHAKLKAKELEKFYEETDIQAIFDVSGGDIANEVLSELDFEKLKGKKKIFWGYSDLTTIVNAIYHKTNKPTCLYQIRNLVGKDSVNQKKHFIESIFQDKNSLFTFGYEFLQGNEMEGIVMGGNIRCLLKLAGTEFMPGFTDKILFLESRSGGVAQMITYLSQYKQLGAFRKVKGIILGSFTQMEEEECNPTIAQLVMEIVEDKSLPIAKTKDIGHGVDSKALMIGQHLRLE